MRNSEAEFLVFCHQLDTGFSGFSGDENWDGVSSDSRTPNMNTVSIYLS